MAIGSTWEHAVVPFIPAVKAGQAHGPVIAEQLNAEIQRLQGEGWEFVSVEQVGLYELPGCIPGLFGARAVYHTHQMLVVRRLRAR